LSFDPILLAAEPEAEEAYPFRRVWRTGWQEVLVVVVAAVAVYVATNVLGVISPESRDAVLKMGMATLPLLAWFGFSYIGERRALRPRSGLVGVLVLGALAANAVAIPLEEHVFKPDQWLPRAGFFGRVTGYALTVGFTAEFLKYAVMRYTVWPQRFQQRRDGIAYALAVSVGFASVYNFRAALTADATVVATALRVVSITFSQTGIGIIMGFFLAELWIGRTPVFWLPSGLGIAALLSGFYYGFRGIAIVGSLSVVGAGSAPVRGLALAFGLVVVTFLSVAFVIDSADARMAALTGRRDTV
jgi:RsiW-degrading membrane proteinase PrsW (M82 family)